MEPHPLAAIFPEMAEAEFAELVADVARRGLVEPIRTFEGKILDGRHRYRACLKAGVEPEFRPFEGTAEEALGLVVALNRHRRHLSSGQRATAAVKAEELLEGFRAEAKARQRAAAEETNRRRGESINGNSRPKGRPRKEVEATALVEKIPQAAEPKARDRIAESFGTNGRYVGEAQRLKREAPDLFERVDRGELKITQAKAEVRRREKRADLARKAEAARSAPESGPRRWHVLGGDCLAVLPTIPAAHGRPRLVFADPPYNIGVRYGDHVDDARQADEFRAWCGRWIRSSAEILADDGSLWILINAEHAAELKVMAELVGLSLRQWIVWYESFGVNHGRGFNRCHRHLLWLVKDPRRFAFDPDAVNRPSDRLARYNDARADPAGKAWDDVWGINPAIPRLTGTCAERLPDFPTQLPLALLRAVVGCASEPGDLVLDPFCGSGTTGAACLELGRRFVGIELGTDFARLASLRLEGLTDHATREPSHEHLDAHIA